MKRIKAGISIGDLNGIGIEVILKTLTDNRMTEFCTPVIFGSNKILSAHKKTLELHDFNFHSIKKITEIKEKKINLLNCWQEDVEINFGKATSLSGKYAFESIQLACAAMKKKEIDILITAPINKVAVRKNIKNFIGHTEFFEQNFEGESLMIMISEAMKIAFVTGHIPLEKVKSSINTNKIIKKAKQFHDSLLIDFGIRSPKIAVMGLNPHAGEDGMLGDEESKIITPAIKKLNENGILAFGPYPADSFFTDKNLADFDGILSMYHDQGLTPFKTLSFSEGVNYTAGLNIIRTSPVHGTGSDIAGKGKANPQSFRAAIFAACNIFKNRSEFAQITSNPLPLTVRE